MKSTLLNMLAIAVLSIGVGGASAWFRGLPWQPDPKAVEKKQQLRTQTDERHDQIRKTAGVSLDEFRALLERGAIVIDARDRADYEKAHLQISSDPPVLNIEPQKVDANLNRLMSVSDRPIMIYCNSEECKLGEELYVALEPFGFSNMKIYFPGWDGMVKAGLPSVAGPDLWAVDAPPPTEGEPAGGGEGTP